jgi:hypothetical protein
LSFATFDKKKQIDDNELGKLVVICYTLEKTQRNDDELGRLVIIYTVPIYKLYQHTQKIATSIIGVVPFGQEPIRMLYTSLPLSSLPLHLLGSADIPTYRKVHQVVM